MKKKIILFAGMFLTLTAMAQKTPDKIYGQLFVDVQTSGIFPDNKSFVDYIPKRKPADIMYDYGLAKNPTMDLRKFVDANFTAPSAPPAFDYVQQEKDVVKHIKNLWSVLKRDADKSVEGSSLLPLPYPYIVPGGRFREIYYWDSYFTMQGLKVSGETVLIENMIDNFSFLIKTYGHIPNGNRSYYLSRSQPPFFSMMVELLAGIKGNNVYKKYLPEMQKEYDYWMEGSATLKNGEVFKRVVKLADGTILNRYWDELDIPRQEGYTKDVKVAEDAVAQKMMTIRFASEAAMNTLADLLFTTMLVKSKSAKVFIEKYLLKDGGIVSTPNNNGEQWDAPNGWAPQQWMAIEGLERYNQKALAKEIATRWIKLNNDVYLRTGKLMEKYNVVNTQLEAGGGEYPGQDGFGWTNGVLLALIKKYDPTNNYLGSKIKN